MAGRPPDADEPRDPALDETAAGAPSDDGDRSHLESAQTAADVSPLDAATGGDVATGPTKAGGAGVGDVATGPTVAGGAGDVATDPTVAGGAGVGDVATDPTVAGGDAGTARTELSGQGRAEPTSSRFRSGERFGTFEVLEQLGSGGMGVVLAAHDPDLDRKVAIKVLRASLGTGDAQTRLLREAQAMAQLSHPNVITVHQVGTRDDRVFVVMEYVDGGTLRGWVSAEPRDWREVLAVYRSAGEGLAAAHRAGLVHRDFKPDNVLIRSDGRVLVTDFGLVATLGAGQQGTDASDQPATPAGTTPAATTPATPTPVSTPSKLALRLTVTGEVMGTPLYMAPEQHSGQRADARADQFAFCVALYEALYGERPFAGRSYREIFASVMSGRPRPPPEGSKVPAWIFPVLRRGMEVEPDARYPEMAALLEDLSRDPATARRRRWRLAGAAVALLSLAALGIALWPASGRARCRAAADKLQQVWNDERREALQQRWSKATAQRVIALLDRYGATWASERITACEATFVSGEQSEPLLDRRMFCLDRRLGTMRALVDRIGESGPEVAPSAVEAAASLPHFAPCRAAEALAEIASPPPELQAEVDAISTRLDRADAARNLGELEQAAKLAGEALSQAARIDYPPLLARAHYVVGFIDGRQARHASAEEHLRKALSLAAGSKAHQLEAETWLSLIYLVGHTTDRPDPALAMAPAAEAAVARAGGDPRLQGRLQGNLGLILVSKGELRRARVKLQQSLDTLEKALKRDDLDTAVARNNLAMLLQRLGDHRAAIKALNEVLRVRSARLGPKHPAVATALNDLGNAAHDAGDLEGARAHLERALAIREAALGPQHRRTGHTLNNLAIVLGDLGETQRAIALARRAVAVAEQAFDKNHFELAGPLNTLGNQLRAAGQRKAAWEAYARALAIVEFNKGRDHPAVTPMLENLARILVELGDLQRALQFVDRAIGIRQRRQGKTHPATINAWALRGALALQAKQPSEAVATFERQRALALEAHGEGHLEVGLASYNLAMAHEQTQHHAEAAKHYRAALVICQAAAPEHAVVANAHRGLGDLAAAGGRLDEARQHYERAVALAQKQHSPALGDLLHLLGGVHTRRRDWPRAAETFDRAASVRGEGGDPALVALARFEQAKALWAGKLDRARARALAREARAAFARAGERAEDNVAEVEAWLRAHPR
jgi:tetratricopeptide (TPR) repeat protein